MLLKTIYEYKGEGLVNRYTDLANSALGLAKLDSHNMAFIKLTIDCLQSLKRREPDRNVGAIIQALILYAEEHFGLEEVNMQTVDFKYFDYHKKAHDEFMAKVKAFEVAYFDGHAPTLEEITDFLTSWIRNHLIKSDEDFFMSLNKEE